MITLLHYRNQFKLTNFLNIFLSRFRVFYKFSKSCTFLTERKDSSSSFTFEKVSVITGLALTFLVRIIFHSFVLNLIGWNWQPYYACAFEERQYYRVILGNKQLQSVFKVPFFLGFPGFICLLLYDESHMNLVMVMDRECKEDSHPRIPVRWETLH
jgi:hypothetical protein